MTRQPKRPPRYVWVAMCSAYEHFVGDAWSTKERADADAILVPVYRYRLDEPKPKRKAKP